MATAFECQNCACQERPFCVERITIVHVIVAIISPNLLSLLCKCPPLCVPACVLIMTMLLAIDQHECAQSLSAPSCSLTAQHNACIMRQTTPLMQLPFHCHLHATFASATAPAPSPSSLARTRTRSHNNNNKFDGNCISYHFMPYVSLG